MNATVSLSLGKWRRHSRSWLWLTPAIVLIATFVYFPVVKNLQLSMYRWNAFTTNAKYVGFENYTKAIEDPVFWHAALNNTVFAVTSVLFQVFFALILAAVLEEAVHQKLRGFLRTLYFIPAVISITVAGVLFSFIYNPEFGLLNHFLKLVRLEQYQHAWLGEQSTAMGAIIGMSQWQNIGYTSVLFIVAIQRIPREYYEAAKIDGAGKVRMFFSITMPLVRQMTSLLIILTVSGAFLVFNEVMVMTAGGPANSTHVLGTWLYFNAFFADDMGYASAIATVIFAITLVLATAQLMYASRRRVDQ